MKDILAIITIMVWPVVPLFWIPVHGLSRIFKKLGILTYVMPAAVWPPVAYLIYSKREFLLQFKIQMPVILQIIGGLFLISGGILQIWTGILLGLWALMGLPEVSRNVKGRIVTEGPFSIVRHPTYLSHTLMFSGIFFLTGVFTVGIITILDILVINFLVIPLEERELLERFGLDYKKYMEKVRFRFIPLKKFF